MVNIVFDGNYLMHKSMYVYQRASRGPMLDTEDDRANFVKKFVTDFAFIIRKFKKVGKVIVTWDDYSWRKNVEIDQNDGYKSNRVKDDDKVNWEEFGNIQSALGEIFGNYEMIISKIKNAEGDDLMYLWKEYFLKKGENVAILSGDRDITQCVEKKGNNYCIVYDSKSTKRMLFAPIGLKKMLLEPDTSPASLLDMSFMASSNDDILELMNDAEYHEVLPDDVIWEKTISGDGGDAVPPVWNWEKTKGDKVSQFKVTAKKAKLIKDSILEHTGSFDLDKMEFYVNEVVSGIKDYFKQVANPDIVKSRMLRNRILVELSETVIPEQIQDDFKIHAEQMKFFGTPTVSAYNMKTILAGTKFEPQSNAYQSDFFSNANRADKKRGKKLF